MSAVFLELFNRAVSAGWLLLALLILRPVLKKLPAWVRCLLWGLAAVRLVLPIRFESAWSLVPSAETLSQNTVRYDAVPQLTSGIEALNSAVNERLMEPYFRADAAVSMNPLHVWTEIAGIVWLIGCAALLLYALVRLVQTKRRVREAALLGDNVWLCDAVASPFILGVLRPRVYLPSGLDGAARDYVLAHERAHLARRDHWWKPLGYLLLAVPSRCAGSATGASAGIWSWPATSGPYGSWASRSGRPIRPRCSRAQRRDGRCWPVRWRSARWV